MLRDVLRLLAQEGTLSQRDVALRLGISESMAAALLEELARLGYLKLSMRCGGACEGCAIASACAGLGAQRLWQMTEKGRRAQL